MTRATLLNTISSAELTEWMGLYSVRAMESKSGGGGGGATPTMGGRG